MIIWIRQITIGACVAVLRRSSHIERHIVDFDQSQSRRKFPSELEMESIIAGQLNARASSPALPPTTMLSRKMPRAARIPLLRPLRPPSGPERGHRPVTQHRQRLLFTTHTPRPRLPYLSQPAFSKPAGPSQQVARLLSTENKRFFRDQVWLAARWTLIGWTFILLGGTIFMGYTLERDERANPTPDEWRFFTRQALRSARAYRKLGETEGGGFVDWARVGSYLQNCLERLEEPNVDGKGLVDPADGEEILIPDVGRAGFDISGKSYPWRTGYFEVLMGCAQVAEHLEGMVLDKTRRIVFPKDVVIGPSNPDPRPVPHYMAAAPKEEDCEAPFDKPEVYYMRILTGQGFTTKQKMDAANGYANWLEYKGLQDSAGEMYRWSVDIAKAALAVPADAVLDERTSVLKAEGSKEATPNLLRATTNLAIHQARTGDLASALPMFLSVLRARREAAVSPYPPGSRSYDDSEHASTDIGAAVSFFRKIFSPPRFPAPPLSGDNPVVRSSEKPTCEESELLLYIGEILFATAPESKEGVAWTRQGVTIAEANLSPTPRSRSDADEETKKCKECLITGVQNWETMLRQLSSSQATIQDREGGRNAGWLQFGGWFGDSSEKGRTLDDVGAGILDAELKQVERLKERIVREGIGEEMMKARGAGPQGSWMGG